MVLRLLLIFIIIEDIQLADISLEYRYKE